MNLGILGAGKIVQEALPVFKQLEDLEIKAICATAKSRQKLASLCETHHIEQYYTNAEDLIHQPNLDVIYIATTNDLHYEHARKALQAKKHVILEKPFVLEKKQAEELFDLAFQKGVYLLEAITTCYLPNAAEIKKRLEQIGRIRIVSMNYSQYSSRYDAFKNGEVLPAFDAQKGGGALMDINIYNIHLALYLFGSPKTVRYYPNMEKGTDTSGILVMNYEGFQCVCIGAKDCKAPVLSTIQGDLGYIQIDSYPNSLDGFEIGLNQNMKDRLRAENGQRFNFNKPQHRMMSEFERFMQIISQQDEQAFRKAAKHSLAVMEIVDQARRQMQEAALLQGS